MPWSVFVHVSARLAPGADPARAAEHARACLRAEGLDDPASLARHQGVDGLPRLVWGSERLVGLTGDEDVFAARLAASLEGDLIAEARVSLGDPAAPEAEVMHAVRGALHALEGARDTMTAERAAALGSGWAELETWEQRASLVHVTLDHPVAALAPLWHALLVGAVDTPRFATGLRYAMVTALSELTRAAGGHPVELRDDELTRTVLDRVRAHLRAGGALPAPWWMLRPGSPADHDAYTQLDHILLSPALWRANQDKTPKVLRAGQPHRATRFTGPRYPRVGFDRPKASDHCPIVMDLDIPS